MYIRGKGEFPNTGRGLPESAAGRRAAGRQPVRNKQREKGTHEREPLADPAAPSQKEMTLADPGS